MDKIDYIQLSLRCYQLIIPLLSSQLVIVRIANLWHIDYPHNAIELGT